MKRILTLLLTLTMLLPLASCASELAAEPATEQKTLQTETKTQEKAPAVEEDPLPTGEIVYPEGFSVGYSRQDISPTEFPIVSYSQFDKTATGLSDPIQLTVTALCDGEKVALICSVDMRGVPDSFANYCATLIQRNFGISKEYFFLNATHTHSSVEQKLFGLDATIKRWQSMFYEKLIRAVTLALHDLTPAEAFIGKSEVHDVTYVRRYLMSDGSYKGITTPANGSDPVAHESDADPELRTIRFAREGDKKDVVMVNFQTHYGGSYPNTISADFIHLMREQAESEMDCLFVYHSGAGANVSFASSIPGERKYPTIKDSSPVLVQAVKDAVAAETPAETGKISAIWEEYQATAKGNWKKAIPFSAITCGDLGFIAAPYEMFDTNGKEIRDASPCKMTFVCSLTGGGFGYVPSALGFEHGQYEVENCQFIAGSGEEFAKEFVRLLTVCKEQN